MSERKRPEKKRKFLWDWSLILRLLAVILSFILLTLAAYLFSTALQPRFSWDTQSNRVYFNLLPTEAIGEVGLAVPGWIDFEKLHVLERSVLISSSAEEMQITFKLVIPSKDANARDFAVKLDRQASRSLLGLISSLFGELRVDGVPLPAGNFLPIAWEVDSNSATMTITMVAAYRDINYPEEIQYKAQDPAYIHPEVDQVLVEMSDSVVAHMEPLPDKANTEHVELVKQDPEKIEDFVLRIDQSGTETRNEADQESRLPRRGFLRRLGSRVSSVPILPRMLFAITSSTPILLFLWLARGRGPNTDLVPKDRKIKLLLYLASVLLLFHFGFHLAEGIRGWLGALFERNLGGVLANKQAKEFFPAFAGILTTHILRVEVIVLGVFAPALFWINRKSIPVPFPSKWSGSDFIIPAAVLIGSAGILAGVLPFSSLLQSESPCNNCGILIWEGTSLLLLMILLSIGGGLWLMLQALTGKARGFLVVLGTLLLAIIAILPLFMDAIVRLFWWVYVLTLCGVLLWTFAYFIYAIYRKLGLHWKPSDFAKVGLGLGILVFALPLRGITRSDFNQNFEFLAFVATLDGLIVPIWAVGMLFLLHADGKADLKLEPATRFFGSLALCTFLFSTLARWFYIPITFLLGWAAIRWLLAVGDDWGRIDQQFKKISKARAELIQHGSLLRTLDHAYLQNRKEKIDKLSKGELSPAKFERDLSSWEKERKAISAQQSAKLSQKLATHPLALGPKGTAWENGLHGMLWASLFATPWFILYLVNFMRGHSYAIDFPILDLFIDLLTIYGRWAGIGFLLGYFFPYLRGNSGLEKSLWLALAVVLPTFPIYFILYEDAAAWQAALFWALQVLIECILLGLLAFDYSTVQGDRTGFQLLLEIHGLRSLSLWTATLIAAIGTSAVTLLSSQAANLIGLTLQALLPETFRGMSPPP